MEREVGEEGNARFRIESSFQHLGHVVWRKGGGSEVRGRGEGTGCGYSGDAMLCPIANAPEREMSGRWGDEREMSRR